MTVQLGTAWLCPVCGGFDQVNYFYNPLTNGWQFPVSSYAANYFSAAAHGSSDNIRATIGRADKRYWEFSIDSAATLSQLPIYIGLLPSTVGNIAAPGTPAGTIGYRNTDGKVLVGGAIVATLLVYGVGDSPCIAWDGATGKVWVGVNGSFSGNPAAGTGQAATLATGTMYAVCGVDDQGQSNLSVTGRFLTGSTIYAPPSGFNCWDD